MAGSFVIAFFAGFTGPEGRLFAGARSTTVEDTRETVAAHFRTAIRRERVAVHVADRFILQPATPAALGPARRLAAMHHGRINTHIASVLPAPVGRAGRGLADRMRTGTLVLPCEAPIAPSKVASDVIRPYHVAGHPESASDQGILGLKAGRLFALPVCRPARQAAVGIGICRAARRVNRSGRVRRQ